MKPLTEVIEDAERCLLPFPGDCLNCSHFDSTDDDLGYDCQKKILRDAVGYLREYRVVTDVCHKHGIASVWGQVLPDVEKTDWDKRLNFDDAFDNDPLTWEELKQIEGKPVWVEAMLYKQWAVIAYVGDEHIRFEGVNLYAPESRIYMGKDNGWQAYRKERG